jgi:pre-rRNA-processing protein TSR3
MTRKHSNRKGAYRPSHRESSQGSGASHHAASDVADGEDVGYGDDEGSDQRAVEARNRQLHPSDDDNETTKTVTFDSSSNNDMKTKRDCTKGLQLLLWDFEQCDPKRCTGVRLANRGLFRKMHLKQSFRGIVLSPQAQISISPADADFLAQSGLSLIDCSWARLQELPWKQMQSGRHRLLPFLVAANTVNYGRPSKLSCAEGGETALHTCGQFQAAKALLDEFSWGPEFLRLNRELLDLYASCKDAHEVVDRQNDWLERQARCQPVTKTSNPDSLAEENDQYLLDDLPPSYDEDDEYGDDDDASDRSSQGEAARKTDRFGNYIDDEDEEDDDGDDHSGEGEDGNSDDDDTADANDTGLATGSDNRSSHQVRGENGAGASATIA